MAEFTKVMRDARRMCESFNSCPKCTLKSSKGVCGFEKIIENSCDESETKLIERKVEQWAKDNPEKTNLDIVRKVFPKADSDSSCSCLMTALGIVKDCGECAAEYKDGGCTQTVKNFFNSPYEEPEESK